MYIITSSNKFLKARNGHILPGTLEGNSADLSFPRNLTRCYFIPVNLFQDSTHFAVTEFLSKATGLQLYIAVMSVHKSVI